MAVAYLRPHYIYVACATILLHVPPYIYIYIYRTSSNLYTPDSVSLASLACQFRQYLSGMIECLDRNHPVPHTWKRGGRDMNTLIEFQLQVCIAVPVTTTYTGAFSVTSSFSLTVRISSYSPPVLVYFHNVEH